MGYSKNEKQLKTMEVIAPTVTVEGAGPTTAVLENCQALAEALGGDLSNLAVATSVAH